MGIGNHDNQVYIVNFSLAKKYRYANTHVHIPHRENSRLPNTTPLTSIHSHLGAKQSHRDDLKSLAYILVYFLCGYLPWYDPKIKQRGDTLQCKTKLPPDLVCAACPNEFGTFLSYARALRFDDKPDYTYLRKLFCELFVCEGLQLDPLFSQTVLQMWVVDSLMDFSHVIYSPRPYPHARHHLSSSGILWISQVAGIHVLCHHLLHVVDSLPGLYVQSLYLVIYSGYNQLWTSPWPVVAVMVTVQLVM